MKRWSVLFALCLVASGCAHDYVTGKSSYNWYKLQDDVKLGNQVLSAQLQSFEKQNVPVDTPEDKAQSERLQQMVDRISKVSHLPNLPYEVHLADAPVVNAWAAPGGKMMVYSGLWDPKKGLVNEESDDEIAAVLAHEISHVTARHVTESLTQNMTVALAGSVASSAIALGGSTTGSNLFGQFFNTGYSVYAPSYSRKNESEADRIGLFYMAKAGYDPRAAVFLWRRMAAGGDAGRPDTHPADETRIRNIELWLPEA
ncbi:MAG TPA: M48 family metallopeptidase, partial [bacterium]|nr:M48 family metallopeptidase [bacterium]